MGDELLGDVVMVGEGARFYLFVNGIKVARRENAGWVNLVPGYSIESLDGGEKLVIDVDCAKLPLGHVEAIRRRSRIARRAPRLES
jgi:hypothetical protein